MVCKLRSGVRDFVLQKVTFRNLGCIAYYLWISATNGQTCFKTPDGSSKRKGTGKTDEKGEFKKMILGLKLKKYKVDILGKHLTEIEKEQRQGFDKLSDNDD